MTPKYTVHRGSGLRPRAALPMVSAASVLLLLGRFGAGEEAGDIDGDGAVTLADAIAFHEGYPAGVASLEKAAPEMAVAPGSLDAFLAHPCSGLGNCGVPCSNDRTFTTSAIFLEAVRRSVADPLPHWWTDAWRDAPPAEPLPESPSVLVRLESAVAPGGEVDHADLTLTLATAEPLQAFFLVLESEGDVLRPAAGPGLQWIDRMWTDIFWPENQELTHSRGDLAVHVSPATYLITRGRLVLSSGLTPYPRPIDPGEYRLIVRVRLPLGLRAGTYALGIGRGSQFVLEDGSLGAPVVDGGAVLAVDDDVTAGWDDPVPPLRIDPATRSAKGAVEFRITDAEGLPGEEVSVRVELRTAMPLNEVRYAIGWDYERLACAGSWSTATRVVFPDPQTGEPYAARNCRRAVANGLTAACFQGSNGVPPSAGASFLLAGAAPCGVESDRPYRPLETFQPLGEWITLTELRLIIPAWAAGGSEVPLVFHPFEPESRFFDSHPRASFAPYDGEYGCATSRELERKNWHYDISYTGGLVRVLGESPGGAPEPLELGIELALGNAGGSPGEVVEVPLFARADENVETLRVAVELDPSLVEVLAADFEVLDFATGAYTRLVVARGEREALRTCPDDNGDGIPDAPCLYGWPYSVEFRETDARYVLLDVNSGYIPATPPPDIYPGGELREIARLLVRIREDAAGGETVLRPGPVPWRIGALEVQAAPGGFEDGFDEENSSYQRFDPALSTAPGTIVISRPARFIRGDVNSDGAINLSDPIATLNWLYLGDEDPACIEAADADGGGSVEISDPILILNVLFLGHGELAPPFPGCGAGRPGSPLGCREGC